MNAPDFYVGLSHTEDTVTFPEANFIGQNVTLLNQRRFMDGLHTVELPNVENSGKPGLINFKAEHSSGLYAAILGSLGRDPLLDLHDGQRLMIGNSTITVIKDLDGLLLEAFTDYEGAGPNDIISGASGAEFILGLEGHDTLNGFAGNDLISGGDGDDTLDGGAGADLLDGGAGSDWADYSNGYGRMVVWLELSDALDTETGISDTLTSIENLRGSNRSDRLTGDGEANHLIGGNGFDDLNGRGGDDIIEGGRGNDTIPGLGGNDVIDGDGGNDWIEAGVGGDIAWGGRGDDMIFGSAGTDLLQGGDGDDELRGGSGPDTLEGGKDRDLLIGGIGNDRLDGGSGNDVLYGGEVGSMGDGFRDTFVFQRLGAGGGWFDQIRDFEDNRDLLDVSALGYASFDDLFAHASDSGAQYADRPDERGPVADRQFPGPPVQRTRRDPVALICIKRRETRRWDRDGKRGPARPPSLSCADILPRGLLQ